MERVKFIIFHGVCVALFIDIAENNNCILSYAHVGQHGVASKTLTRYKRATIEQYTLLKNELESYPFNYKIKVI
jgi:hypothetical protein